MQHSISSNQENSIIYLQREKKCNPMKIKNQNRAFNKPHSTTTMITKQWDNWLNLATQINMVDLGHAKLTLEIPGRK